MLESVATVLRKLARMFEVEENTPPVRTQTKRRVQVRQPSEGVQTGVVEEEKVVKTQMPDIRRPRRMPKFRSEWHTGDPVVDRSKRNDYQRNYRAENPTTN